MQDQFSLTHLTQPRSMSFPVNHYEDMNIANMSNINQSIMNTSLFQNLEQPASMKMGQMSQNFSDVSFFTQPNSCTVRMKVQYPDAPTGNLLEQIKQSAQSIHNFLETSIVQEKPLERKFIDRIFRMSWEQMYQLSNVYKQLFKITLQDTLQKFPSSPIQYVSWLFSQDRYKMAVQIFHTVISEKQSLQLLLYILVIEPEYLQQISKSFELKYYMSLDVFISQNLPENDFVSRAAHLLLMLVLNKCQSLAIYDDKKTAENLLLFIRSNNIPQFLQYLCKIPSPMFQQILLQVEMQSRMSPNELLASCLQGDILMAISMIFEAKRSPSALIPFALEHINDQKILIILGVLLKNQNFNLKQLQNWATGFHQQLLINQLGEIVCGLFKFW